MKRIGLCLIIALWASTAHSAQVCVDVPDAAVPQFRDAFAASYNYQATVPDPADTTYRVENRAQRAIANPQTKAAFAKRRVAEYIREVMRAHRVEQAVKTVRDAETGKSDPDVQ